MFPYLCTMINTLSFLSLCLTVSFLLYGYHCLFSEKMSSEFDRFGLTKTQRRITGVLQITGALGLLAGLFYPGIGLAASIGLSLLMLLGFGVRLKIKDSFVQSFPSFLMFVLNLWATYLFYNAWSASW